MVISHLVLHFDLKLLGSSNPLALASQSAGITGISHHIQPAMYLKEPEKQEETKSKIGRRKDEDQSKNKWIWNEEKINETKSFFLKDKQN